MRCERCGTEFNPNHWAQKFCDIRCKNAANYQARKRTPEIERDAIELLRKRLTNGGAQRLRDAVVQLGADQQQKALDERAAAQARVREFMERHPEERERLGLEPQERPEPIRRRV